MQCKCWSCCRITKAKHVPKITKLFSPALKMYPSFSFAVLSDLMPPALLILMCLLQEQFCLQPYRSLNAQSFSEWLFPPLPGKAGQMWLWTSITRQVTLMWLVPNRYNFMASLKTGYKMQSNHNSELVLYWHSKSCFEKHLILAIWF